MSALTRFEFESRPLTFEQRDGEWWANGDEVAAVLGYSDRRKVLNLFKRHEAEFLPEETLVLNLRTNPENRTRRGNLASVRLFSPRGLEHLAILGRTPTCTRFRRWLLDVVEKLRTGSAALVTRAQAEDLVSQAVTAALKAQAATYERAVADVEVKLRNEVATVFATVRNDVANISTAVESSAARLGKLEADGRMYFPMVGRAYNEVTSISIEFERAQREELTHAARKLGLATPAAKEKRRRAAEERQNGNGDGNGHSSAPEGRFGGKL